MKNFCTSTTPNKGGNFQLTWAGSTPQNPAPEAHSPQVGRPFGFRLARPVCPAWRSRLDLAGVVAGTQRNDDFTHTGVQKHRQKNAPEAHSPQVDRPLNARTRAANFLRVVTNGSVFFLMRVLFFCVVVTHYKKLRDTLRQTRLQLNSAKFKPGALFLVLISLCALAL